MSTERRETGGRGANARSARRRAREFALQGIYQWLLSGEDAGVIEAHLENSPGFDRVDRVHFDGVLRGVLTDASALRERFGRFIDRRVEELSPVEHAALLIGAYELVHHLEIPYRVVINEAVELTKTFGGTDGFRYVNGVLDRLASEVRAAEFAARA